MYNRYIRNDNGVYDRVPQPEVPPPGPQREAAPPPPPPPPPRPEPGEERRLLERLMDKLHLGDVDSGDLLLLVLLFFLFRQEADEEVLIALGLLLIL